MIIIDLTWDQLHNNFVDINEWCANQFGPRVDVRDELTETARWSLTVNTPTSPLSLKFYSKDDVTLFKLRWLS
jgi:hypothetical protein